MLNMEKAVALELIRTGFPAESPLVSYITEVEGYYRPELWAIRTLGWETYIDSDDLFLFGRNEYGWRWRFIMIKRKEETETFECFQKWFQLNYVDHEDFRLSNYNTPWEAAVDAMTTYIPENEMDWWRGGTYEEALASAMQVLYNTERLVG